MKTKLWFAALLALLVWSCGDDGPVQKAPLDDNNSGNNTNQSDACIPTAGAVELCDGKDNDCDGETDEGFPELGESCSDGVGACATDGVYACAEDQVGVVCVASSEPPEPSIEICDGLDNDCDGETDEDFSDLGEECSAGDGACANLGIIACTEDGTAACNAIAGQPGGTETCNNMDDDCDGEVDEGFDVGTSCSVGIGACENTGTIICDQVGGTMCDAVASAPPEATEDSCDNVDNDCDGEIDEGCDDDSDDYCDADMTLVGSSNACPLGGNDCNDDDSDINPGADEVCDSVDNDCDGSNNVDAVDATTYYADCDDDGYSHSIVLAVESCSRPPRSEADNLCAVSGAEWVTRAPVGQDFDCHYLNPDAHPRAQSSFTSPMIGQSAGFSGWDYDCDGEVEQVYTNTQVSSSASCPAGQVWPAFGGSCIQPLTSNGAENGWTGLTVPNCGQSAQLTFCSYSGNGPSCPGTRKTETRQQRCH